MTVCRTDGRSIVVVVRLTPRASRDAVDGLVRLSDDRIVLAARVRALPQEGAANAALAVLLAKAFGVPKSSVAVIGGARARLKEVRLAGDPERLAAVVRQWPEPD